ncbi:MAG: tyrosine-type recombinase/integrase [Lachnospiraceae bacterium]|nr:tyrosine-type recombinase/integrase [Lachnospiraceae bacterium]
MISCSVFHFHELSHTYASRLLMNGVEISVVSKLLGHDDINTTYSKYIHVLNSQLDLRMKEFKRI